MDGTTRGRRHGSKLCGWNDTWETSRFQTVCMERLVGDVTVPNCVYGTTRGRRHGSKLCVWNDSWETSRFQTVCMERLVGDVTVPNCVGGTTRGRRHGSKLCGWNDSCTLADGSPTHNRQIPTEDRSSICGNDISLR